MCAAIDSAILGYLVFSSVTIVQILLDNLYRIFLLEYMYVGWHDLKFKY
jgi:hypothetical protein